MKVDKKLMAFLNEKVDYYNQPSFIYNDPISIPHLFSKKQDIEIAGFFAAIFSWGNRTTIINKSKELMQLMDMAPYDFIKNHSANDLKKLLQFKHRTFNADDLLYFVEFFHRHYKTNNSLESAFSKHINQKDETVEKALIGFRNYFFSEEHLKRTEKHIASPANGSTCKRLNMFLRWMVRNDDRGVDFGIWKNINPSQLICPIDVHVARISRKFGLINNKKDDWQTAFDLTKQLKKMDPADPVKYDYALFTLGIDSK